MHPLHAYPLKPFLLAFPVTVLLTVAGMPTETNAAEDVPVKLESAETKPRQGQTTPGEASAQPDTAPDPEKTTETLREVSITATRTEREIFDVPSSIAVIGPKQLAHEPQATIAEQLRDIPGVQVNDGGIGGGAKRVSIRGESGSRVLVLIDGMKISEQKSMDGSMIMIDPLNIERIEVIKGPASVLYGSEAIGGVVNVITKKGGTRPVQGTLATTYNSATNSLTPYASLYGSYNGFSYRVSGDYTDADDKRGADGKLPNTSYMEKNWSAYLDYAWEKGRVGAGYDHYWSSNSIPGVVTTEITTNTITAGMGSLNVTGPATVGIDLDLPKWKRDRVYAFAEFDEISEALKKIKVTPFMQWTHKDFTNTISLDYDAGAPSPMPPPGGRFLFEQTMEQDIWTRNKQTSHGLNLQTDWMLGASHYVIAGMDYLYDDLDASTETTMDMLLRMRPNSNNPFIPWVEVPAQTYTNYIYKGSQKTLAAYVQDEWLITPDWTATIGLRATWIDSKLSDTNDPALDERSTTDSHVVGSAGLVYSGFEDWRLRGTYSQGYRYPSLNQLYIGTSHGNSGYNYPDPNLQPEKSNNFELGVRYDANGFVGDFGVFYSMADDYIAMKSLPNTFDNQFTNMDSATTYGAELILSYTFEPWELTPYVSGAYLHRRYDQGENGGKTSDTGDPHWTGRAGLKYEHRYSSRFSVYADAFGRFSSRAKEKIDDDTTDYQAGWGTANLALGARFGEERNVFVDLGLNNLFDKRYTPAKSSVEDAGFNAVVRVGMEF